MFAESDIPARRMRAVARHATFIFDHRVYYLVREARLLVALETDRVSLGIQQIR